MFENINNGNFDLNTKTSIGMQSNPDFVDIVYMESLSGLEMETHFTTHMR